MTTKHTNNEKNFLEGIYSFDIRAIETDFNDTLHMSSLFAMMQEAAYNHSKSINMGADRLDPINICWLLSKKSVRMKRMPSWHEPLRVKTWSRGARRLLCLRDFEFYSGEDGTELIGQASSEWFLASQETHRPVRPEQVIDAEMLHNQLEAPSVFDFDCPKLKNLELPEQDLPLLLKYADYSDIDRNGHVNNTRYVAWAVDAVQAAIYNSSDSDQLIPMTITGIDIQYISEIVFKSKVLLFVQMSEQNVCFVEGRTGKNENIAFRSRIFFHQN